MVRKPRSKRPISASFSRLLPGLAMRIVSLRVAAIGRRPAFDFSVFAPDAVGVAREGAARIAAGLVRRRLARHRASGRGSSCPSDAKIAGPAILEQPDATTVIEPGLAGRIDRLGNLIVEPA